MDNQRSTPLLTWAYYCQGKSIDELRHSLLLTTLELETTRLKAEEELRIRDAQFAHLKSLLSETIRDRDEAQDKCHGLLFEKLFLQQQQQIQQQQLPPAPLSGVSSVEDLDEPRNNNGFSSSDCDESFVSSPPQLTPAPAPVEEPVLPVLASDKPLPEKGKLLQAVMKAGPLLQTLLLAGSLPQWRHPPPAIDSYQIPPPPMAVPAIPPPQLLHQDSLISTGGTTCNNVDNSVGVNDNCRKRGFCEQGCDSPREAKYQRVVLQ